MTDDGLDDTQKLVQSKGYKDALKEGLEAVEKAVSVGKQESVYEKEIWNAAIEAAAKLFDSYIQLGPDQIRKLKK